MCNDDSFRFYISDIDQPAGLIGRREACLKKQIYLE